jgi:hypothetical protein
LNAPVFALSMLTDLVEPVSDWIRHDQKGVENRADRIITIAALFYQVAGRNRDKAQALALVR